jgi:hypothetical protein
MICWWDHIPKRQHFLYHEMVTRSYTEQATLLTFGYKIVSVEAMLPVSWHGNKIVSLRGNTSCIIWWEDCIPKRQHFPYHDMVMRSHPYEATLPISHYGDKIVSLRSNTFHIMIWWQGYIPTRQCFPYHDTVINILLTVTDHKSSVSRKEVTSK